MRQILAEEATCIAFIRLLKEWDKAAHNNEAKELGKRKHKTMSKDKENRNS